MKLTHATGAKEKQLILAVVPQYYQTQICIHSYEFAPRVFQMSTFYATLYLARIPREYVSRHF